MRHFLLSFHFSLHGCDLSARAPHLHGPLHQDTREGNHHHLVALGRAPPPPRQALPVRQQELRQARRR